MSIGIEQTRFGLSFAVITACATAGLSFSRSSMADMLLLAVDFNSTTSNGSAVVPLSPTQAGFTGVEVLKSASWSTSFNGSSLVSLTAEPNQAIEPSRDRGSASVTNGGSVTMADLYRDFVIGAGATSPSPYTIGLNFTGLTANTQYSVVFYTYDPNNHNAGQHDYRITDVTNSIVKDMLDHGAITSDADYRTTITGTADASGKLSFTVSNALNNGTQTVLNGFTISSLITLANLMVSPAAPGPIFAGGMVTLTNSNGGTFDVSGKSLSGAGWSQAGLNNGTGLTANITDTLTHTTTNSINGNNQGRISFTVANASTGNGVYNYMLSDTVSGKYAPVGTGGPNDATFGTAQTATILSGNILDNYYVQTARNTSDNVLGTKAEIVTSALLSSDTTLSMSMRRRDTSGTANEVYPSGGSTRFNSLPAGLLSDVVDITGIDGTLYILRMYYNTGDLASYSPAQLSLGYFNTTDGKWELAVLGNHGSQTIVNEGNTNYLTGIGGSLDIGDLGKYGVDIADGYVWAVLNHNSEFAVIPEPASLGLLAIGSLVLLTRRKSVDADRHH